MKVKLKLWTIKLSSMKKYSDFIVENDFGPQEKAKLTNKTKIIENTFKEEDKKILNEISDKTLRAVGVLEEINNFLKSYNKINNKIIESSLNNLKSFNESVLNELKDI